MIRLLYQSLTEWKNNPHRLPLILLGARQVGKTYLLNEFGQKEFLHYFEIDFEKHKIKLNDLFERDLEPKRILNELSVFLDKDINTKTDLLIFDEIQNCPKALTALKYLHKDFPELAICCAGSLLGISLTEESFPVGSIHFEHLYPMNFEEFILAVKGAKFQDLLHSDVNTNLSLIRHEILWDLLKIYYFVGGMPKAVQAYCSSNTGIVQSFATVREIQKNLILAYMNDINKHSGKLNAMHISCVFENIPRQLSANHNASVTRYRFKDVIKGKRSFTQLEGPIQWLEKSGLIIKSPVCNRAEQPLISFTKDNIFRLFIFDVGILGALLDLKPEIIMENAYGLQKGFYAENFVACELKASGTENILGWQEANAEIEFLLTQETRIIPIEVKAGQRTKAKSLSQYLIKYHPEQAVILSANQPKIKNNVLEYPLYLAGQLPCLLK